MGWWLVGSSILCLLDVEERESLVFADTIVGVKMTTHFSCFSGTSIASIVSIVRYWLRASCGPEFDRLQWHFRFFYTIARTLTMALGEAIEWIPITW